MTLRSSDVHAIATGTQQLRRDDRSRCCSIAVTLSTSHDLPVHRYTQRYRVMEDTAHPRMASSTALISSIWHSRTQPSQVNGDHRSEWNQLLTNGSSLSLSGASGGEWKDLSSHPHGHLLLDWCDGGSNRLHVLIR